MNSIKLFFFIASVASGISLMSAQETKVTKFHFDRFTMTSPNNYTLDRLNNFVRYDLEYFTSELIIIKSSQQYPYAAIYKYSTDIYHSPGEVTRLNNNHATIATLKHFAGWHACKLYVQE